MPQLVCTGGFVRAHYPDTVDVPPQEFGAGVRVIPWPAPKKLADLGLFGTAPPPGEPDTRLYAAPTLTSKADLISYAALARYYKQIAGISYMNAAIDTHPAEVTNVASILAAATAASSSSISYKAASGFVTFTLNQFSALLVAMNAHVQAAFAGELQAQNGINANPQTIGTMDQIDAIFAAITI